MATRLCPSQLLGYAMATPLAPPSSMLIYIYICVCMHGCFYKLLASSWTGINPANVFLPLKHQGLPTPLALRLMLVRVFGPDELCIVFTSFLHSRIRSSFLRTQHHLYPILRNLVDDAYGVPIFWAWLGHGEGQCLSQNARCFLSSYQLQNKRRI